MSPDKKKWLLLGVGTLVIASGLGALIYLQNQSIEKNRAEVARLAGEIEAGRALVATTPELEHNVILQRETDAVIKEILSDEEEATNLVRTINDFEAKSGISVKSLKLIKDNSREKAKGNEDFGRVGYTVTFDADAFQFLAFLDALESHKRFINVRSFKLTAAKRAQIDRGAQPVHNVSLDLETYVYSPKQGITEAKIDNYDRKRDLLLAEIQKRSNELRVPVYEYAGARSRRDPWLDPRMTAEDGEGRMPIPEQLKLADQLQASVDHIHELWKDVEKAKDIIALMKARTALVEALVPLEEELERVQGITLGFKPVEIRIEQNREAVAEVRKRLEVENPGGYITAKELQAAIESVKRQMENQDYEGAISHYSSIEPQLHGLDQEPEKGLAEELSRLATNAQTVLDFEKIEMTVGGVAIMEGARPVVLINGDTIIAGEYVDMSGELFVNDVRPHEIEFIYRGVTLIRPVDERTPTPIAKAGDGKRAKRK